MAASFDFFVVFFFLLTACRPQSNHSIWSNKGWGNTVMPGKALSKFCLFLKFWQIGTLWYRYLKAAGDRWNITAYSSCLWSLFVWCWLTYVCFLSVCVLWNSHLHMNHLFCHHDRRKIWTAVSAVNIVYVCFCRNWLWSHLT